MNFTVVQGGTQSGEVSLKRCSPTRIDSWEKIVGNKNVKLFLQVPLCCLWVLE